jgi:SAM-dependent methyltransferase
MFQELEYINHRPKPFEFYTARDLWTDEHTSKQMLTYHLDKDIDVSSRNAAFIDKSVEWIITRFNINKEMMIADFGCGPGLYTTRLAKKQAKVTGIDFSNRSIQYAREVALEEGLSINYINQDYLTFKTAERFDLILMIMCDFCVLSPAQRKKLLGLFHTILKPGGLVLLDVYSLKAFKQRREVVLYEANLLNGFWSPENYFGFLNTFKYYKEQVILDKYTIVEANRTRTIYNWLQYFSPEKLEDEFIKCGFKVDSIYSNVAGLPFDSQSAEFAVIAQPQVFFI